MQLKPYEARVRIDDSVRLVRVDAINSTDAKQRLEALYGRGTVVTVMPAR
ncbi:MAG: hypothetical protein ABJM29_10530 [Rhizobiaceae bacterium]